MAFSAQCRDGTLSTVGNHSVGMSASDHALLRAITRALSGAPFAATVDVFGLRLSRETARAIERQMLRLRVAERAA